jgi:F420-dependent oxidoreductase-like protein
MHLGVMVAPQQGASYDDQLRAAQATEAGGFSDFVRSDHYLAFDTTGLPGPTDSWITLAGLARETRRVRLGTMVSAATFRLPGPLAIAVAQVDAMSGGRITLALGAGWAEQEHRAYGIPFPSPRERFERLEEQLELITGMWRTPVGETFSYEGTHYQLVDCPALPKPLQIPHPPVIVGGTGPRRTPNLAARFADEFNLPFVDVETSVDLLARVDAACAEIGRDPAGIVRSAAMVVCVGRDDAEVARRAAAIGREVDELRRDGLAGTPDEVVDKLGAWQAKTGISRAYLQVLDLADLDHVELIAQTIAPQLRS